MRITYVGPFDQVIVPALGERAVGQGETIEVDDELGARLVRQKGSWAAAAGSRRRPSPGGEDTVAEAGEAPGEED